MEEFYSTYGDDDKEFVGSLSNTGLFTPASDGPNPQRKFSRNNYGDVWVVATAKNEKDKDGKPLIGKSYLVVTVPTYMQVGSARGGTMTMQRRYRALAFIVWVSFIALNRPERNFLYLVPAGAIFAVDTAVGKLIDCLTPGELPHEQLVDDLTASGLSIEDAEELIEEMDHSNVIVGRDSIPDTPQPLPDVFPIQTLVMNLTNQCNLSCQYCYEFGADKVATPEGKPKFMDVETAKTSVDFLLAQSGDRRSDSHHVLRRRDADEFSAVEGSGGVRATSGPRSRAVTSTSA